MKINLKKMLPYFEDEELMEIYEKIAERGLSHLKEYLEALDQ